MSQELTPQERAEFAQLLQDTFAEQQVQTLLSAFERLTLRSDPTRLEQALQNLQAQVIDGQQSLQGALEKLAEAQARTDNSLQKLAEAQERTEGRVGNLEAAMERLAQAQERTDDSLNKLAQAQARTDDRLQKLAEAQERTEGRVGNLEAAMERLAQAQERTDDSLNKLAQAQARMDESLKELSQEQAQTQRVVRDLARQVGGLSNRLGGDLEDTAYIVLHDVLGQEFGWQVGVLERTWKEWNGEAIELDIFGQAHDPARPEQPIWIVGEAKYNLTLQEVERFAKRAEQGKKHLGGEVFVVCFCYRARPEVRARLQELDIRLVFSYGRLV